MRRCPLQSCHFRLTRPPPGRILSPLGLGIRDQPLLWAKHAFPIARYSSSSPPGLAAASSNISSARQRKSPFLKYWPLEISLMIAGGLYYFTRSPPAIEHLNDTRFVPFGIVKKEEISPTAFIITVEPVVSTGTSGSEAKEKTREAIQRAWTHGLWSLEFKQPQLQIARHYTPLPPLETDGKEGQGPCELRFLIRHVDGGEMSKYLSALEVGEQAYIRGPHLGFNVPRRLGDAKDVVFLAGGTGIAPALQLAHKVLGGAEEGNKLSIRMLWANRRRVDSLNRNSSPGKADGDASSLHRLIAQMERAHGEHFKIDCFVDEEKRFITMRDIENVLKVSSGTAKNLPTKVDDSCIWHSPRLLCSVTERDDAVLEERENTKSLCSCKQVERGQGAGRNLLAISGPEGFLAAMAGPKVWLNGKETQGPIQGLFDRLAETKKGRLDHWLVLKT